MAETSGGKTLFMLIGAIVFGIVAAGLSVLYIKSREKAFIASLQGGEEELVTAVIAKNDMPQGLEIKLEYFDVGQIPGKYVSANMVRPEQFKYYIGRFVNVPLEAGKPLLASYLVEDFPVDFSDLVKQGQRAMTITVDEVNAINGLIRPGNKIDVFVNIEVKISGFELPGEVQTDLPDVLQKAAEAAATGALPGQAGELIKAAGVGLKEKPSDVILPVLQNLQVLATGREAYDETLDELYYPQQRTATRGFTTITVNVSPKQAALLAIAEDKGDLLAVLRNRKDPGSAKFSGITPFDLFANAKEMERMAKVREAAEAMGATLDENGNWVTKDGKILSQEQMEELAAKHKAAKAAGYTINENGDYVDANGNVIKQEDMVFNADGTVTTKDAIMAAAGYTVNENGDYVDANGNVIKKEDLVFNADGSVSTKSGQTLIAPSDEIDLIMAGLPKYIGYTVGGESEGGVAKDTTLPVVPLIQEFQTALEENK